MNATKKQIKAANAIAAEYCKCLRYTGEIQEMYERLNNIGVSTGALQGMNKSCEWYIDGERVDNSLYVYSVYKPENSNKVEFTIYFS